jgi:hypothetical protein
MSNSYFSEVALSGVLTYPVQPQIVSGIRGPHKLLAICTAGSVELSFTGSDSASESFKLDAANGSNKIDFGVVKEGKFWVKGSSGTIRIYIWQAV